MSAVFITGSGTDVGKTFVTGLLCRQLRAAGKPVGAIKPVVSGFDPARVAESDPAALLMALGREATLAAAEAMAPWRFAQPLSPDMAASREGRFIDFDALLAFCRAVIQAQPGTMLIEGVGGAMVPLTEHHLVIDWISALDIPSLMVTGSYLGSLSHSLTAVAALKASGLMLTGIVVSETPASTVPLQETAETLRRFVEGIPVVALPRVTDWTTLPDLTWLVAGR